MKLIHLAIGAAAAAFIGGAAYAQQPQPPAAVTSGSVTGDWNGAHAPPDEKQYQEKVTVPVGAAPSDTTTAPIASTAPAPAATDVTAPAATSAATNTSAASFTNVTVTNGPIPDTPANRKKYGQPLSHAGKMTLAKGN